MAFIQKCRRVVGGFVSRNMCMSWNRRNFGPWLFTWVGIWVCTTLKIKNYVKEDHGNYFPGSGWGPGRCYLSYFVYWVHVYQLCWLSYGYTEACICLFQVFVERNQLLMMFLLHCNTLSLWISYCWSYITHFPRWIQWRSSPIIFSSFLIS